jgi:ATP-binding cassette subfamily A (ABC1) protein 3
MTRAKMTAASHRPHWKRIYRQTLTLCYKNFLVFYKAPIATICRALLFPIIVTVIFCELKHLGVKSLFRDTSSYGIAATSLPVKDLANAITSSPSRRIVFVRNGIPKTQYYLIVDGIAQQTRMQDVDFRSVDDPDDLFDLCKQSLHGSSHCFAAVIFTLVNDTNVDYSIAFDGKITSEYSFGDYRTGDSTLTERVLPLQWAIDSHIGNFSTVAKPSTQTWSGYFGPNTVPQVVEPATRGPFWLSLIGVYVAPVFNLILIGVVYHLNTFVASERETSISELMAAQSVTTTPRIVSTLASFFVLYFPGYLICSILFTQILFTKTSDILFLFLSLLAGASMVASSHFIASFFGKAQLAGLYSSTLAFALALVTLAASLSVLDHHEEVIGLSLLFPPATYANLIADVARREFYFMPFSLNHNSTMTGGFPNVLIQKMDGYLYMVFFIIQIVVFSAGTYAIEKSLWGVTRNYDKIDASSNIALKCTNISKTYYKKRRWYWPFMRKDGPVLAINKLDLTVKKGSVTFLLGPNGGGKTTTLKCIAGMTSMDPGSSLELNEDGVVFGVCPQSNVR